MIENKQERNLKIYQSRRSGASVNELAKKYELSPKRIRAICKQQDNLKTLSNNGKEFYGIRN